MADELTKRLCPRCNGTGETGPILACGPQGSEWISRTPCWVCKGAQTISGEQSDRIALGERVRAKRLSQYIHQAGLAAILGTDRVDYSKAESLGVGEAWLFDRMANWLDSQV